MFKEVSPPPADDYTQGCMTQTRQYGKHTQRSTNKVPPWNGQ